MIFRRTGVNHSFLNVLLQFCNIVVGKIKLFPKTPRISFDKIPIFGMFTKIENYE